MLDKSERRLWHYNSNKIERKRYQDWGSIIGSIIGGGIGSFGGPGTMAIGAGIGGGIGGMFGKKKKSKDDPLADIRAQLQAIGQRQLGLAGQVPGLVEKQKQQIRDIFGGYKKTGLEQIAENIHAERELGGTSIEPRLQQELFDKLAKGQAAAELEAEMGGIKLQSDIFGTGANILGESGKFITPETTTPDWTTQLLGAGGQLLGQEFATQNLLKLFKPRYTDISGQDWMEQGLKGRPGWSYKMAQ